jgi:hypothetical protein
VKSLGQTNAAWAGDRGEPDAAVRSALAAAAASAGTEEYLAAVAALCGARLLLPIVASGDENGEGPDPDRHAEMAAVMMTSASCQTGMLAFTGLDALLAFDPKARPVPCTIDEVAATAVQSQAHAVVVDVAGPYPLILEAGLIAELAAGRRLVAVDGGWGWLSLSAG